MAAVTSAASAAAARIGAALSDAQYFESSMVRVEDIRRQLDSNSVKEKLDAMKRVIALISLGKDASTFFPDVVKNVVAPSLDVKKLVYLYLVHYAEEKQDLALLAINTFQKDLSDHNQHIRALSLRVLSSIRVKVILQVVILAIGTAAKDSSSYVRKAAAHAISKVCALDTSSKELLMEPLKDLLSDLSPEVIGSAVAAFEEVCPYDWQLIHPHYRRYCTNLSSQYPWGQVAVVHLLLRYARSHFAQPSKTSTPRNPDLDLLLNNVTPMFYSMNAAVVSAAVATYYHIATPDEFCTTAIKPLMRLVALRSEASQAVALNIASAVATRYPAVLIPYVSEFYVSAAHSATVRSLRVKVLMRMCATAGKEGGIGSKPHARRALLAELREYLHRREHDLAASAARAIGCLATAHPESTPAIVKVLSSVVSSTNSPAVVTESIGVLRRLLQRHPTAQAKALPQLIAMLLADGSKKKESIKEPAARASIIWLIAEFYDKVPVVATEALRLLARGFSVEGAEGKLQILNLAAKVVASAEMTTDSIDERETLVPIAKRRQLLSYVLTCARYDRDYDVRDKARMLNFIFFSDGGKVLRKHACKAFMTKKPVASTGEGDDAAQYIEEQLEPDMVIGSLAHVLNGRRLPGFHPLEPWSTADLDDSLRGQASIDGGSAAISRDYVGVSSTDYQHYASPNATSISSSTWMPPTGISSADVRTNGLPMLSRSGEENIASSMRLNQPYHRTTSNTAVDVDPEKFYEDEEDSSGYDDDSYETDDEDDEGDAEIPPGTSNSVPQALKTSRSSKVQPKGLLIDTDEATPVAAQRDSKKSVRHVSNEYDLDDLLGGLTFSTNSSDKKKIPSKGPTNVQASVYDMRQKTDYQRVLEPWNASGLEIDAAYMRPLSADAPDITPIMLRVTNNGKNDVTQVGFASQCGNKFECQTKIPVLAVNQSTELSAIARFAGKASGVRFTVTIDEKGYGNAELKPTIGFLIKPHLTLTPHGFLEAEKNLKGMFSSEASIVLPEPKDNDWIGLSRAMEKRLLSACFVAHIKTSIGSELGDASERFSSVFAGYQPLGQPAVVGENPVLLRVTVKSGMNSGECSCKIWIGCEKVLLSANLLQLCKTTLNALVD
ncbi:AP-3 complex subunit beta-1 [Gracilaria domingensis]|nr:AP-3 complex subunit beta-1 [Gracilaria domingensis]